MAQGIGPTEAAKRSELGRTTLWRLMNKEDPEALSFQAQVRDLQAKIALEASDGVVAQAVEDARRLAPKVIAAWEKGLDADTRFKPVKVTRLIPQEGNAPPIVEQTWELMGIPDVGLAVRTADLVARRYPEMAPKSQVEHSGSVTFEARLREYHDRAPD